MSKPLPSGVDFRPMHRADVATVLEIIRDHDEDDFEEASETFAESLDGQYVLTLDLRVIGSTGAGEEDETDNTWWLSWTYLAEEHQGSGLGAVMLVKMLELLREWEARKVFVTTSDYTDLQRGQIYRDAIAAYERLGFVEESRHPHYYDLNEAQIVLGLRLLPESERSTPPESDMRNVAVLGLELVPETDDALCIDWEFTEDEGSTAQDVEQLIEEAEQEGGRVLFASAPSDASEVMRLFRTARLMEEGRLLDFYRDGVDDVRFRFDLR